MVSVDSPTGMPEPNATFSGASVIDLFCGAGGLTRGLLDAGLKVVAGYDIDPACEFPYAHNNKPAKFKQRSVTKTTGHELNQLFEPGKAKVLVGCAPCQPFSTYSQGKTNPADERWSLLDAFLALVQETQPVVVSLENVPGLRKHDVFKRFTACLVDEGFHVETTIANCPDYGIPQRRKRLVLLASRLGPISLIGPTHERHEFVTVRQAIGKLPILEPGVPCEQDIMHRTPKLGKQNQLRIAASVPGGSWRDWPEGLTAECHKRESGQSFGSVYGRMCWDEPSPTMTTQFFGFGNGRFGHPEQDRALSLREGAVLQTFPVSYRFVEDEAAVSMKTLGKLIGNAVPVLLGKVIGISIRQHLEEHRVR